MPIPLPIETERLLIRAFEAEADSAEMTRAYCDPEVMRYIPGGVLADERAVHAALTRYAAEQAQHGFSSWAVVARESGRLIGDAGFAWYDPPDEVELGYTLAREYWGNGYATEAARTCLQAGLEHLPVSRIVSLVDERNEASLRVSERLGMRRVGRVQAHGRAHVLFATRLTSLK